MQNLQRYLQEIANVRRSELLPYVFTKTEGRVQTGPFKGMAIIPRYMWGDGDTAAKLMGVYEDELHDYVEHAIASAPDAVINVGSAEGYYSIGFATRLPNTPVLSVDVDGRAAGIVKDNASANGLTNVTTINQLVDHQWLRDYCAKYEKPLLVFDCEGAELELLDPNAVPGLKNCSMLVECHDCAIPGIIDTLKSRFQESHVISAAAQKYKDPYQFSWCDGLSDCDKWALVHEGRPSTMTWLYMVPKR